ncbi:MAG: VWA domain-containing protein [Myxococcales bacterium]|nr:VWA domain-containing protein [Myxococcales bacterium]
MPRAPRPRAPLTPRARWRLAALAPLLATLLSLGGAPQPARADMLHTDPQRNQDVGYTPVQERSYEVIVGATKAYKTELRVRVALRNSSTQQQDVVLTMALPRESELRELRVARDGAWSTSQVTALAEEESGRREPGAVYARALPPETSVDLPGAELIAFSLEPDTTTQVELVVDALPKLRGDRWEIEMPGRGDRRFGLSDERRVLVKDPQSKTSTFWVDGQGNDDRKVMISNPENSAVIAWPAKELALRQGSKLDVHYTARASPDGDGGELRMLLRLGPTSALKPDHVLVLIDRSRSTDAGMHRQALRLLSALFDHLPPTATFDALSFARVPTALVERPAERRRGRWPSVRDDRARTQLANKLDGQRREQGTDIGAALTMAGARLRERGAKRPLILVLTDGMLPPGHPPGAVRATYEQAIAGLRSRPAMLLFVDEPMLTHEGLAPTHPAAMLASALDARIRLDRLDKREPDIGALLSSPRVVTDLEIALPRRASLDDAPTTGLVSGHVIVARGTYEGTRPPAATIKARDGGASFQTTARAKVEGVAPPALVAALAGADLDKATREGFVRPPWITNRDRRLAQLTITWAGRGNQSVRGYLDRRIFRNYLGTRVYPRARACYNEVLTRNEVLGGRVTLELEVSKGEVMLASVAKSELDHPDARFEACLVEAAWALDIPAGTGDDRIYRVRYPLQFSPPRGGRPSVEDDALDLGTIELLLGPRPSGPPSIDRVRR